MCITSTGRNLRFNKDEELNTGAFVSAAAAPTSSIEECRHNWHLWEDCSTFGNLRFVCDKCGETKQITVKGGKTR